MGIDNEDVLLYEIDIKHWTWSPARRINFGHEIIYEELYSKGNQQELPWISQFGKEAVGGGGLLPSVPGQGQSGGALLYFTSLHYASIPIEKLH